MKDTNFEQSSIGKLLLEAGKISSENVDMILSEQKTHDLRFGEAAKQLGLIKQADIDEVLDFQFQFDSNQLKNIVDKRILTISRPYSKPAEKIRSLRNQIAVRWLNDSKSIILSSPHTKTGTSIIAANIAVSFAQIGKKTLLIDANMRTPTQHNIFNVKNNIGFSDLLAGKAGIDQVDKKHPINNLTLLCSGVKPPNPAELISRGKLKKILEDLESKFEVIIIDTPSTNEYEDAIAISSYVKGVMLVVRKDRTTIKQVKYLRNQLEMHGSNVIGAFINEY